MLTAWFMTGSFNWVTGWKLPVELIVAMLIFVYGMKTRRHFAARVVISLLIYAVFVLFVPHPVALGTLEMALWINFLSSLSWCILAWAILICLCCFCFDETISWIVFCSVGAHCVQHASMCVYYIIAALLLVPYSLDTLWMQYIIYAVCYLVFFLALRSSLRKDHSILDTKKNVLALTVVVLVIFICFNIGGTVYEDFEYNPLFRLYGLSCALLLLVLQFTMLSKDKYVAENQAIRYMWQSDRKHYESQKREMELINIKVHDLKHMQTAGTAESESGMKTLLAYYDAGFRTGCEALDVVLTEKNYTCVKLGICFTFMADGRLFGFMEDSDIYSLFGNILDNAIEAVEQLPPEMRQISMTAVRNNDILSVTESNYFSGRIEMRGGEPVSSKQDKSMHGFGLKSIRYIADKYGGSATQDVDGNVYRLNVIFF
ncbi:MAG: ATP-binding protein, partial [Clostridia bacterium]|nr:ATP-binding protein [Clostridia bacterium]